MPGSGEHYPLAAIACAVFAGPVIVGAMPPWVDAGFISAAGIRGDGMLTVAAGALGKLLPISARPTAGGIDIMLLKATVCTHVRTIAGVLVCRLFAARSLRR